MILLDPYLRTLQLFLPKAQRDDIIRELSGEIEAQAAEQEQELGRPLNIDEEAAVIGRYGHPLLTAARYRRPQHLIGPLVFPYYWLLLRVILCLVAMGHFIGAGVLLTNGAGFGEIGRLAEQVVEISLKVLGWVTLLAAGAELWLAKSGMLENWNPRVLIRPQKRPVVEAAPRVGVLRWPVRAKSATAPSVSRFIVHAILGVWWLLALRFPVLLFAGVADVVAWGPAMNRLYPVLSIALTAELLQQFVSLARPHDDRFLRIARVVLSVNSLFFLYLILMSDHQWIVWRDGAEPQPPVDSLINNAFSIAFTFASVVAVLGTLRRLVRWFTVTRRLAAVGIS